MSPEVTIFETNPATNGHKPSSVAPDYQLVKRSKILTLISFYKNVTRSYNTRLTISETFQNINTYFFLQKCYQKLQYIRLNLQTLIRHTRTTISQHVYTQKALFIHLQKSFFRSYYV